MAARTGDKVMALVEKHLAKNPKVSNADLFERAKKVDAAVGKLSLRQFHAKYPLQVKRRRAPKKRPAARRRPAARPRPAARSRRPRAPRKPVVSAANRDAVRKSLLKFAKDVSAATNKTETIDILANVDKYVDEIMKAAGAKA